MIIDAPFSDEQVELLKKRQNNLRWHPYTGENGCILIPTNEGWRETLNGPVVQTWAHSMDVFPDIETEIKIGDY